MPPSPTDVPSPFPYEPVPPDLLEWAKQTFDEQEYQEGVREIQATGGHPLDALIAEIEVRVNRS